MHAPQRSTYMRVARQSTPAAATSGKGRPPFCLRRLNPLCCNCRVTAVSKSHFSDNIEDKYTPEQKYKILEVINNCDTNILSSYDISKARVKKFTQWKSGHGQMKTISDVEYIEGFSEKSAKRLFDSILDGTTKDKQISTKIKGQILYPNLSGTVVKNCKSVLTVYISVNSVCWTQIQKDNYELVEWKYYNIDYPDGKRFLITDILNIAWRITQQLPHADIYVMKAEATTLRAAGSDPSNPKVVAVNLQKAQMVAMIVALINSRSHFEGAEQIDESIADAEDINHKVYFLRPSLPYRLYGTLVGNEKVSTDQTVEMLLRELNEKSSDKSYVRVPETLKTMFRSQKELQKDMLGHCLLLSLTFMDLCIYKNQERIAKLLKVSN